MAEDRIRDKQQKLLLEQNQVDSANQRSSIQAAEDAPIGPPHASEEWRKFYSAVKRITESMRL